MSTVMYPEKELRSISTGIFTDLGFSGEDAAQIADVLLLADLYGIESHGVQRLFRYHKGIEEGSMRIDAAEEIIHETPVSLVVDGHMGMGQLIACRTMRRVIEKAKRSGIAVAAVRNSNHYGIAGYYAKMACDEGLIGLSATNTAAVMVPTGGKQAMLGTNPVAVAAPADPYPFFFDASTTVVARGKIEVYHKNNRPIPDGWGLDRDGHPSADAAKILADTYAGFGGIMPVGGGSELTGGHKGYGFGMVCELFTSILSLGLTSNAVSIKGGGVCHGFAAIDPGIFGDAAAIRQRLSEFLEALRRSPAADGARIYTHGEKEIAASEKRRREGIPVDPATRREMEEFRQFAAAYREKKSE